MKKTYDELKQGQIRSEQIMFDVEQSNLNNRKSRYDEEQILEAQKAEDKKEINKVYETKIFPGISNLLYLIYNVVTLITMPFVILGKGNNFIIITFYILLIVIAVVSNIYVKYTKKHWNNEKKYFELVLEKYANDTSIFTYMLTSLGYIVTNNSSIWAWFIYACLILIFLFSLIFGIKNTKEKLRR